MTCLHRYLRDSRIALTDICNYFWSIPADILAVFKDGFFGDEPVGFPHLFEDAGHPIFHSSLCCHTLSKVHGLSLRRDHRRGQRLLVITLLELQRGNVVEHLTEQRRQAKCL